MRLHPISTEFTSWYIPNLMLFHGFESLARILVIGVFAYVGLVLFLRVSGRRTLSKMNSFDFIVTIALGSTLANVLLNRNVSLTDGLLAFGLLIGLQFLVTWTSVRMQWVRRIITGDPIMLFHRGDYLPHSLRKARVTKNEVRAAVRSAGVAHLENVGAVILETDGSFSVIRNLSDSDGTSLEGVKSPDSQDRLGKNTNPERLEL